MIYRNYWLVVGRMRGDDEDCSMNFEHCTREQAVASFVDHMWELEFYTNPDAACEGRAIAESMGEGVFVTLVCASDSPIDIIDRI